jgi:DNA-binding NtrC family response regulator
VAIMLDPEITSSARLRILAVEADPHVRAVAVDTLEEAGFEVIEAATADRAAIILHARNDPSVVFTDAVTPGELNGLDLARMALILHPQIVVIVVAGALPTGFSSVAPDARFLPKPYRMAEVIRLIHELTED